LRFVIAIVLFVVAFVTIGYGIAQRTILQGAAEFSTQVSTGSAPITVVDGAAINALPGTQSVKISGQGDIFLAYGRTTDVLAWVDDLSFNHVTFDSKSLQLVTETVAGGGTSGEGETAVPTPPPSSTGSGATATPTPGATDAGPQLVPFSGEIPDPHDSDLWVQEFDGSDELIRKINAPQDISLIIMSNGVDPAPNQLTFSWPLDNTAPLSGPLIIAGIISMLAGLAAFLWALVHARQRRGPRRKQPRLPKAPQPKRLKRAPERKALKAGGTQLVAASGLLVASLALTGCTTGSGVLGSGLDPEPSASATDIADANNLKPPAVTKQQFARIVAKVAETIDAADADKDAKLAATRLDGPALLSRVANYKVTAKDASLATITAFAGGKVELLLPQQNDGWPRSVFAVVDSVDPDAAPAGMMVVQESPRDNYKVRYLVTLEPGLSVPPMAPATIGSVGLLPDNGFGILQPDQLAASYGAILIQGDKAPDLDLFDAETDTLRTDIGFDAKQKSKKDIEAKGSAKIVFTNGASPFDPISFPTNDSGQVVAVSLDDIETVTPVEAGAAINATPVVKAMSGVARSAKGYVATYGVQLLFYVPSVSAATGTKIQLLGFTSGLIAAKEAK
jgi:hypothetical protein